MKIAVSGLSGCGNSTACLAVAKALRLKSINFTFRDLAEELGMDFEDLAEKRKQDRGYDLLLDKMQLGLYGRELDAIMGSRLAIWLADANLRVWLDAPLEIRAKRIAKRETKSFEDAFDRTKRRDIEDRKQYLRLYGIDILEHDFADLILDAEKFNALQIARKIISEAKKDKYKNVQKSKYGDKIIGKIEANLKSIKC
ncbi:MAG: cytidylate kinase family protein [Candidatus Micrarchaeota archaeon]